MKPGTFDEWLIRGYRVKKGEKATGRNDEGRATFTRAQVEDAYAPMPKLHALDDLNDTRTED